MLLHKRAEEMVALTDKAKAEPASSDENISGDIYMGNGETEAVSTIAKVAEKPQKDYPLIRYHIYSGDIEHIAERPDKGLIDFGLLVEPFDIGK